MAESDDEKEIDEAVEDIAAIMAHVQEARHDLIEDLEQALKDEDIDKALKLVARLKKALAKYAEPEEEVKKYKKPKPEYAKPEEEAKHKKPEYEKPKMEEPKKEEPTNGGGMTPLDIVRRRQRMRRRELEAISREDLISLRDKIPTSFPNVSQSFGIFLESCTPDNKLEEIFRDIILEGDVGAVSYLQTI